MDQDVDTVIIDSRNVVENGELVGLLERQIAQDLQRIGDHFTDAIPSRNKEGKTAEDISPLSYEELK